ncbi:sensor domain-containing diguanylate cyclase [Desulfurivibrio alkaliphilus]|uniref:diguanylate cyclase n=1 Tax=Desulfurivibrio alkaliphilus (strain DSM 19089 / UNIQEM U267 / AHT2) TaxID=589865 RepID=D6Z4K3_DESAT|nr:sensor domain-containing diguanylate cyclase [Desulfurivibrio alkaliphilus]ADH86478.1 diguanylate cyclase with GAF sensor [Desulfurivibrio alkaliphilus AHT 2]
MNEPATSPLMGIDDTLFLSTRQESENLQDRLLKLYHLYSASKACCMAMKVSALLANIVALLKKTLEIEEFYLLLQNEENGSFEMWAADEQLMEIADELTFRAGTGLFASVIKNGKPLLVQNIDKDDIRFILYKKKLPDVSSLLSLPLLGATGQVFGLLNIHKKNGRCFDHKDELFLFSLAQNMALALERTRLLEKAQQEAMHDELTGIYNRRFLFDYAHKELCKNLRSNAAFSLMLLDIDHFKQINDNYGHLYGDQVLRDMATTLKFKIRQSDVLARYGGEEFAVLLPNTAANAAFNLGEKLRLEVEKKGITPPGKTQLEKMTVTVGLSSFPADSNSLDQLFSVADQRLYKGKSAGRNRTVAI